MKNHRLLLVALLAASLTPVAACRQAPRGDSAGPTTAPPAAQPATPSPTTEPTPSPTPEPARPKTTTVRVYFSQGEKIGVVARRNVSAQAPARAAIEALLSGPTQNEEAAGFATAIPAGTRLRGLTIRDGLATIDLTRQFVSGGGSLSVQMRTAQVVCTLTQFTAARAVAFRIDGKAVNTIGGEGLIVDPPVDRREFEDMLPAILVESPLPGDKVTSPTEIRGSANVFEANFRVQVVDDQGKQLLEKSVMATSGTGNRGTFRTSLSFSRPRTERGSFIFDELSAEDGRSINLVEVPVRFR